jgi:hypothetical protein
VVLPTPLLESATAPELEPGSPELGSGVDEVEELEGIVVLSEPSSSLLPGPPHAASRRVQASQRTRCESSDMVVCMKALRC